MKWHNEPPNWEEKDNFLKITSGLKTDFWRKTHYGFIRDSGHFRYQTITGNFQAIVKIVGKYQMLYDQAGLMIRVDEKTWLKCGIEFVDGTQYASTVVTKDYSDWSIVSLPKNPESLWLKLERKDSTIKTSYSLNAEQYSMMRLAHLTETETVQIGLMSASPEREGFEVTGSPPCKQRRFCLPHVGACKGATSWVSRINRTSPARLVSPACDRLPRSFLTILKFWLQT